MVLVIPRIQHHPHPEPGHFTRLHFPKPPFLTPQEQLNMSAEHQTDEQSAAATSQPGLRTIDFSSDSVLRQVTTMLRRAWLVDPPLSDEDLADPDATRECFRCVCEAIGAGIAEDEPAGAGRDHARWLARTQLTVLDDPAVAASAEPPDPRSVLSPWRGNMYDVYRHVFADLSRALPGGGGGGGGRARYDPAKGTAVSLAVLRADEEKKVDRMAYRTDTFLYPVWLNPKARVVFTADGAEHVWSAGEESTWTAGMWVRGGKEVVLTTETDGVDEDQSGLAAVFVTGHCDEAGDEKLSEETRSAQDDEKMA